ncbi:bifunctional ADP-dependent NAD(P)H-hydrate dehydratase/NAD(P)H-hydrate epimerase [Clostridium akagii]|uniref:bifunctional ADP-dependent NAD(P)H-hydrate dehydratase/NAD(P)H-hydrate epimerase n=1 Tax=Clostridium akagii TaxID=91623 RepID=UPI00047CE4A9|nr:bifunctional ADP-dependent NAD(P)H-hydrate dehydratase/NAD(P)H-hydrate epimerase [Clostridium akagii]
MRFACSEAMKKIDDYCISKIGISELVLMENAALKVLNNLSLKNDNFFVLVCGTGNNGGDGFAIARHLFILNKSVRVFFIGSLEKISESCRINYEILKNMGVSIHSIISSEDIETLKFEVMMADVVIDGILGTGIKRNVTGIYEMVISVINENSKYILSIDVPSGLDSNTGKKLGSCIVSNKTVTFQLYKKGFLTYGASDYLGDVIVENIGIPEEAAERFCESEFIIDRNFVQDNIATRDKYSHKGDYGSVLVFAGSNEYVGAAYICSMGAARSGAGLVTLCSSKDILNILREKLTEVMTVSFEDSDRIQKLMEKSKAIALGPGMGNTENTFNTVIYVLKNAKCPIVLDADGLNVFSGKLNMFNCENRGIVITPHLGEMSRLTGLTIDFIKENRISTAQNFAKEHEIIVLLKGYNTVITDGITTYINPTGNSAMASGGMGDCLTGIIAGFIAQGLSPLVAAAAGAYIHGLSGETLSKNMFSVSATELLREIPYTIHEVTSDKKLEPHH